MEAWRQDEDPQLNWYSGNLQEKRRWIAHYNGYHYA
jgi:hypothetical protein